MGDNKARGTASDGAPAEQASGVGVFTTDAALTVRTWDEWLARATGIPSDEARGRALVEVIPDLAERGLLPSFEQVLARGAIEILAPAFHRYLIACRPDGESAHFDLMQQRVTIGPLREDDRVVGTIVAIEDVTARLERERELAAQLSHLDPGVRLDAAAALANGEPVEDPGPLLGAIADENWRVRRSAVAALKRRPTADVIMSVLQALRAEHRNFSVLSSAIDLLAATETDVIEPLLELLRSPDADLRIQAALVLGERGDGRAIEPVSELLDEANDNLRFHAIEALGKLKAASAIDALIAIAESGNFFLAFPALEALALIGDPSVAPRVARLIADDLLRSPVVDYLGRMGDEEVVTPLVDVLNDAAAPTEIVAAALASVYERYETRYRSGEQIAQAVRLAISATGTQNLLDAVQRATAEDLRSITTVLGWLEGPAVERALTRLLGQDSVRSKVVESLVRYGARVVDLLIEQLDAEDLDTRHAAVVGLGRIGDRRATPALIDVLGADPELTVAAAGALGRIGDSLAFGPLFALIGHEDAAVRQAVIAALNSIGHAGMANHVRPLLHDAAPRLRESAVRIAGYFGYPECADDLLACCRDEEAGVQRAALEHLAFLEDPRVLPTLTDALGSGATSQIRCAAAQALARLDEAGAAVPLLGVLSDPDPWVRYYAARGLGAQRHEPALDELTRLAFADPAGHVRLAAIAALGQIAHPSAVPALSALAASEDTERAQAALQALGRMSDDDARQALRSALRGGDDDRQVAAAGAIARFGGEEAIDLLEWTAAAASSERVVAASIRGLAALAAANGTAAAAVRALTGLAADNSHRDMVIEALGSLDPSRIAHVGEGLGDSRAAVRVAVVQALGRMRHIDASRRMQAALADQSPDVRLAALTEFRHLGTHGQERRVVAIAHTDADPLVRRAALMLLKGFRSAEEVDRSGAGGPGTAREH